MKHSKTVTKLVSLLCLLLLALTLASCTPDTDIGDNTPLSERFMDHVMANDYNSAYGMVKATVTDADFRPYWQTMQAATEGAETYEMQQIGWNVNRSNGVTTRTTAYQVYLDNDHIILLRTVTQDGIEGIAGIHFSDITDFIRATDRYIPVVRIILYVFSGLCMAFTLWMLVDCLRRKLKHKALWAILIFFGVCLTFTVGETSSLRFNVGLFFQTSSITADPGLVSVVTKIVLPVGAILYLCLRKKFVIPPETPVSAETPDLAAPATADASEDPGLPDEPTAEGGGEE